MPDFDHAHYWSITELGRAYRDGSTSPVAFVHAMIDRIERIDPVLHSYATFSPVTAMAAARVAQDEMARGIDRGPLHGVPVAIKDIIEVADMPTMVGMPMLRDAVAKDDAIVVKRLRNAGAIILGKLQMTEGATMNHHAQVKAPVNPWGAGYTPGFSSSGSGVAVAAGLCTAALGSDTAGSIRIPSAANGVTGLKPTWGKVSLHGVAPFAPSFDTVGPMTRSAIDAAIMLGVIDGADDRDIHTISQPAVDYAAIAALGASGLTIGIDPSIADSQVDPVIGAMLRNVVALLRDVGASIRIVEIPDPLDLLPAMIALIMAQAATSHAQTYPARKDEYGPDLAQMIEGGRSLQVDDVDRARLALEGLRSQVTSLFDSVDMVLLPAIPTPIPRMADLAELQHDPGSTMIRYTLWSNVTGLPSVTLPYGLDAHGIPLGFQLVGRPFADDLLLRVAHAIQQVTSAHMLRPPVSPD